MARVTGGVNKFLVRQIAESAPGELYNDPSTDGALNELQAHFRGILRTSLMPSLTLPEASGPATLAAAPSCPPTNIGVSIDTNFEDFQSVSQDTSDDPATQAPATSATVGVGRVRQVVEKYLAARRNSVNPTAAQARFNRVTQDQVLNRLGAMSCGGCHQFSNGRPVFDNGTSVVTWPSSAGFVHVVEGPLRQ